MIVTYGAHLLNDNISRCFFHFFKILILRVFGGVKVGKIVENDKKICLLYSLSQEPYIIWLSFMEHFCKMIISWGIFFISSKLIGRWKDKNGPKWRKFCPSCSISQEPYIIWLSFVVHICKMIISPGVFSSFQNIFRSDGIMNTYVLNKKKV